MQNFRSADAVLGALKEMGVRVAAPRLGHARANTSLSGNCRPASTPDVTAPSPA